LHASHCSSSHPDSCNSNARIDPAKGPGLLLSEEVGEVGVDLDPAACHGEVCTRMVVATSSTGGGGLLLGVGGEESARVEAVISPRITKDWIAMTAGSTARSRLARKGSRSRRGEADGGRGSRRGCRFPSCRNPKTLISHKVRMKSNKQRSLIPSRHSLWLRLRRYLIAGGVYKGQGRSQRELMTRLLGIPR